MKLRKLVPFLSILAPLAAAAEVSVTGPLSPGWGDTIYQAKVLYKDGKFAAATTVARRALPLARRFGPTDDRLAANYFLLGTIARQWGHCGEAHADYARAVAIWERQPAPKPSFLFNSILSMLNTSCECEDYEAARKAYRVYGDRLQRYSSGPLDESRLLSLRAALARERKEYPQAEALLRQSLAILEHAPIASPEDIVQVRNSLAVVLGKQGLLAEALAEAERVIAYFEQSGQRHPSLVASLNSAACSLGELGRQDEAERMFQRALTAASDLYGEENRFTSRIMLNYAQLLREEKQGPAALAMQQKGLELYRRSLVRDNGTVDITDLRPNP